MKNALIYNLQIILSLIIKIYYISLFKHSYGIQFEPIARQEFEKLYGYNVVPAGLFVDFHIPFLATSPDGLVGDDSIFEIKCPFSIKNFTPHDA